MVTGKERYEEALRTIARGDYDNAHDSKAAAGVAKEALAAPTEVSAMERLWGKLVTWSQRMFGADDERGLHKGLEQLKIKCDNALKNPMAVDSYTELLLLTLEVARFGGMTLDNLIAESLKKLAYDDAYTAVPKEETVNTFNKPYYPHMPSSRPLETTTTMRGDFQGEPRKAEREPSMAAAMTALQAVVGELEEMMMHLEKRLVPVMRPSPSTIAVDKPSYDDGCCEMAARLYEIKDHLVKRRMHLEYIVSRL